MNIINRLQRILVVAILAVITWGATPTTSDAGMILEWPGHGELYYEGNIFTLRPAALDSLLRDRFGSGISQCGGNSEAALTSSPCSFTVSRNVTRTGTPIAPRQPRGDQRTYADLLFEISVLGDFCITCDFMSYFMLALTSFSQAIFTYFQGAFRLLAPVMIAIWLGYRVSKLMVMGGEDGRQFIYNFVQKMALFLVVWLITTAGATGWSNFSTATGPYLWRTVGPTYLNAAFGLSTEVRDAAIAAGSSASSGVGGQAPADMNCGNVRSSVGSLQTATAAQANSFIPAALNVGCFTERVHMIGLASGLAVVYTAFTGVGAPESAGWLSKLGSNLIFGAIKVVAGVFMMTVFAMSAVWLIFLMLDVVTRGLITAAFAPIMSLMFLFAPTRGYAVKGINALAGAAFTAVSLSLVSVLAYFLLTNTVEVYEATWSKIAPSYGNFVIQDIPSASAPLERFQTFIKRIQEDNPTVNPVIPMDFSSPWFWYLCMSGVAIFALGKKLIAMLEGMIGYQGASAFADNALKVASAGAKAGLAGGALTMALGQKSSKVMAGPALGMAAAGAGAMKLGGTAGGQALRSMYENRKATHNIFGNLRNPAMMAPGGNPKVGLETSVNKMKDAISDVSDPGDGGGS
jgi:hypothetical protein